MSEMKPCPFCGADNGYVDVIPNPFSNDIYSRGHCIKCHAVGTFYMQSYLEGELRPSFEQIAQMATEQWNTRPIEDELRKCIAELEAERKEFCPNCEAETPCTHEAELFVCDICGEDFAKYIVLRNCTLPDVSVTQDVTTPEPPEGA